MPVRTIYTAFAFDFGPDGQLNAAPDDATESRSESSIRRKALELATRHAGVIVWSRTSVDGRGFDAPVELLRLGSTPEVSIQFNADQESVHWLGSGRLASPAEPLDGDAVSVKRLRVRPPGGDGIAPLPFDLGGAILSLCSAKHDTIHMGGTAFLVAPGIAMTAAHVVTDLIDRGLFEEVMAVGADEGQLRAWQVVNASVPKPGEVAVLTLSPRFPTSPSVRITTFELTASRPAKGDRVVGVGVRPHASELPIQRGYPIEMMAEVFSTTGSVEEFVGLRPAMAASAVFQTDLTTFNSMSGGPVFDADGLVVGLINSGILVGGEPSKDVTFCAVPWPAMFFKLAPQWPEGLYTTPYCLIETCHHAERLFMRSDGMVVFRDQPSN